MKWFPLIHTERADSLVIHGLLELHGGGTFPHGNNQGPQIAHFLSAFFEFISCPYLDAFPYTRERNCTWVENEGVVDEFSEDVPVLLLFLQVPTSRLVEFFGQVVSDILFKNHDEQVIVERVRFYVFGVDFGPA